MFNCRLLRRLNIFLLTSTPPTGHNGLWAEGSALSCGVPGLISNWIYRPLVILPVVMTRMSQLTLRLRLMFELGNREIKNVCLNDFNVSSLLDHY